MSDRMKAGYGALIETAADRAIATRFENAMKAILKKRLKGAEAVAALNEIGHGVGEFGVTLSMKLRTSGAEDIIRNNYLTSTDAAVCEAALSACVQQWMSSPIYGIATKHVLEAMHKHGGNVKLIKAGLDALRHIVNVDLSPELTVKAAMDLGAGAEPLAILQRKSKAHTGGGAAKWGVEETMWVEYRCVQLLGALVGRLRDSRLAPLPAEVGLALLETLQRFTARADQLPLCLFTAGFICKDEPALLSFVSGPDDAVRVVVDALRLHVENPKISRTASILAGTLAKHSAALNGKLAEAGACELMVDALRRFPSDPEAFDAREAALALADVAAFEAGAQALLRLDVDAVAMGKLDIADSDAAALALCTLLRNLAAAAAGREQLLAHRAHLRLIEALSVRKGRAATVAAAAAGLRNLATLPSCRVDLLGAGAAAAVLEGMRAHTSDRAVRLASCGALCELAREPANRAALRASQAAVAASATLMGNKADADSCVAALSVLQQLAEDATLREALVVSDHAAVALAAAFALHGKHAGVMVAASALLEQFASLRDSAAYSEHFQGTTGVLGAAGFALTTLTASAAASGAAAGAGAGAAAAGAGAADADAAGADGIVAETAEAVAACLRALASHGVAGAA